MLIHNLLLFKVREGLKKVKIPLPRGGGQNGENNIFTKSAQKWSSFIKKIFNFFNF